MKYERGRLGNNEARTKLIIFPCVIAKLPVYLSRNEKIFDKSVDVAVRRVGSRIIDRHRLFLQNIHNVDIVMFNNHNKYNM